MKLVVVGVAALLLAGCAQQQNVSSNVALKSTVATLEKQVNDREPGLGEIMGTVEQHHIKLYYAGRKADWPLASYELNEIQESFEDAADLYPAPFKNVRVPLPKIIPAMTKASMASVREAIQQKNEQSFVQAYQTLSASCSSCHAAENHPFIKITTPAPGMFSDQKFTP
jgi:hypothetical protein